MSTTPIRNELDEPVTTGTMNRSATWAACVATARATNDTPIE